MNEDEHICGICGKKLEADFNGDYRCDKCNPAPETLMSNIIVLEDE